MHPTTATQATPEIRFTPFLDDQSLPDFAANHNTNRRLGAFNTGLHGPAGDLHTPSKLLTPEGLLDQFTSVVTPLHKTNSIKHVDPFNQQYLAPAAPDLSWGNPILPYQPGSFVQPDDIPRSFPGPSEGVRDNVNINDQAMPQFAGNSSGIDESSVGDNPRYTCAWILT